MTDPKKRIHGIFVVLICLRDVRVSYSFNTGAGIRYCMYSLRLRVLIFYSVYTGTATVSWVNTSERGFNNPLL